jgi:protein ImuB
MFAGIHGQNLSEGLSLAEFAYSFSPFVEEVWPDTVVIDVEGCGLCFGSAYELATIIAKQACASRQAGGLGTSVNVALAANPDAAVHAARRCAGITFTTAGEELTCLGPLRVSALEYSLVNVEEKRAAEIFETLKLWGVLTFKEFAELPVAGVSERLGQEGVHLQQLAAGKTERHLKLKQAAPVFENSIELEYPIAQLEPLSFIFARLLNQICASLQDYALATNELHVQMKLENKSTHELKLNLPYPMRDQKVFLKLLLLEAEAHPPTEAIVEVSINCEPVKPRVLQTGLFIPLAPEPAKLELTLARLAKLVGLENVGSPQLLDTYRPDAFGVKRFELKERKSKRPTGNSKQRTGNSKQQTVSGKQREAIPNSKFKIPNSRFQIPNSRFQVENSRIEVRNSEFDIQNSQSEVRNSQFDISKSQSEIRNSKSEIPTPQSEIRNPQFEVPTPKFALGFRRFRPPLRAMVEAARGYPTEISAWGKGRSVYGKVVGLAGPWRTSGEWWRSDLWARDEWDVAVEARGQRPEVGDQRPEVRGQRSEIGDRRLEDPKIKELKSQGGPSQILYRIYRELKNGTWFVEGIYD